MNKARMILVLIPLLVVCLLLSPALEAFADEMAVPMQQADSPAAQCVAGVELWWDGQDDEALPLLSAGFAGRESATFVEPDDEAMCALALAILRDDKGDQRGALEAYQVAVDIFRATGNQKREATTLNNIGFIHQSQEDYDKALAHYRQALALTREVPDRPFEGIVLGNIGKVYHKQGDYEKALDKYQSAVEIHRELDNGVPLGKTLNNIGDLYSEQGDDQNALGHYQQALSIVREVGPRDLEATVLNNLGQVYESQSKVDVAYESYQQALSIAREVDDQELEATILNNIDMLEQSQAEFEEDNSADQETDHDPVALCAKGVQLYLDGQDAEALPLLEAGFAGRESATFPNLDDKGDCALNLAELRDETDDLRAALEAYEVAREVYQASGNLEGEGIALARMGLIYFRQGDDDKTLEYFQQALPIFRNLNNCSMQETILNSMGVIYQRKGDEEKALEYAERALSLPCEGDGSAINPESDGSPVAQCAEGMRLFSDGQIAEALPLLENGFANRESGIFPNQDDKGMCALVLGILRQELADYSGALEAYQVALDIFKASENRFMFMGSTFIAIGEAYRDQGRHEEALSNFNQALQIARDQDDPLEEGTTLNNIGLVYQSLGRFSEALESYQKALEIFQKVEFYVGEAAALNNIGAFYESQGKPDLAEEYYEQALQILRQMEDHTGEASILNNIGGIYLSQGDYERALERYGQALEIAREVGDRAGEASTLNNIGGVYRSRADDGDDQKALENVQQALDIHRDANAGNRAGEANALGNIGFLYYEQERYEDSLTYFKDSVAVIENIRGDIKVDEFKTSFASGWVGIYQLLVEVLIELERPKEAFNYVERAKARTFLDQLANGRVDFRAGVAAPLLEQEQAKKAQITALRTQLITLQNRPINEWDRETMQAVQDELTALEGEYEQLLIELKVQSPEVASLISVDVAPLTEIQSLLDPKTTLVEYFVTEEHTLAFVITHDSFQSVTLDVSREELAETIDNIRTQDFATLDDANQEPNLANLQQLHAWLIAPLQPHLTTPVLGIVPHDVLHYLPFAALTDGERFLSEEHTLFTLPSASMLRFLPEKRKPNTDTILALGNPTIETLGLRDLPYAEQEAQTAAKLYGTQALTKTMATESTVWSQAAQAGILHLAAHGQYNRFNTLFSTIHLASDELNDGRLEVHEIYGLDLTSTTDLVVLSACQTQVGDADAGDEVVALNRAFLYAGTPTVIATLWSVDDKSTGLFMERFYTHLQAGMGKAEALRQAQIDTRAEYPHPYYWAAFTLVGEHITPTRVPWLLLGGAVLTLVVLGGGLWMWKMRSPKATVADQELPVRR